MNLRTLKKSRLVRVLLPIILFIALVAFPGGRRPQWAGPCGKQLCECQPVKQAPSVEIGCPECQLAPAAASVFSLHSVENIDLGSVQGGWSLQGFYSVAAPECREIVVSPKEHSNSAFNYFTLITKQVSAGPPTPPPRA